MNLAVAVWDGDGDVQLVQELLAEGITYGKNEALVLAAKFGYTQIVELLLLAGANVHFNDDEALQWAASRGHTQIVELLLLADAEIRVLSLYDQQRFKHSVPTYISIQEYLLIETLIINIVELADRFIVDVVPGKKYVVLK